MERVLGDRASPVQDPAGWVAPRRRHLLLCAALISVGLSGCGWHPLYGRPSPDPASGGAGAALAQVAIDPVTTRTTPDPLTGKSDFYYDSRTAQMLQNDLRDGLNPYGQPATPAYHLAIQLSQDVRAAASLGNGQSTREDLIMVAIYRLNDENGKSVLQDQARIVTSYDVTQEPLGDLSSHNDALQRGAQQLAEVIQTQLSVFFGR